MEFLVWNLQLLVMFTQKSWASGWIHKQCNRWSLVLTVGTAYSTDIRLHMTTTKRPSTATRENPNARRNTQKVATTTQNRWHWKSALVERCTWKKTWISTIKLRCVSENAMIENRLHAIVVLSLLLNWLCSMLPLLLGWLLGSPIAWSMWRSIHFE